MIVLGQLGKPYGVHGWLKLISYTVPFQRIFDYSHWFIQSPQSHVKTNAVIKSENWQPVQAEAFDSQTYPFLIKIPHCNTPEQAKHYTHSLIGTLRDDLPPLPKDEFYWADLEGLTVINTHGTTLGKIDHLLNTGANDILFVHTEKKPLLIPYLSHVVLKVDLAKKIMQVDWEAEE